MRPGPFRSLLDDAACQREMLTSIGQRLRDRYAEQIAEPLPDRLQELLQRLAIVERQPQ